MANEAADLGRVQINGKVAKAASDVKEGDVLTLLMGGKHLRVRVISVQEHALKADASGMYEVLPQE